MSVINMSPKLKAMFDALDSRIRKLELSQVFQAPSASSDPLVLRSGMLWYRSDVNQFKAYQNATVTTLIEGTEGAWTTYVPTVTAQTGTFTTVSATGRYSKHGRVVTVTGIITITTNGTAAGFVAVSLPVTAGSTTYIGAGRESTSTGSMLAVVVASGANAASIYTYSNTYPGGTGYTLNWTVTYESAT